MIRAVLDANILVAGFARLDSPTSAPAGEVRRWFDEDFILIVSNHVLIEVGRALAKRYFDRQTPFASAHDVVELLRADATAVQVPGLVRGVAPTPPTIPSSKRPTSAGPTSSSPATARSWRSAATGAS